jgi:uncharacterized protein
MEEVPRFVADRMLKRLARWLRLIGADVLCDEKLTGAEALRLAREQNRHMLTRDKRLRTAPDVMYIESQLFRDQLREVLARFPFNPRRWAFTRCSYCNEPLQQVSRETVMRRVPPFVYASRDKFALCDRCGRVYWDATHLERALRELESLGL